MLNFVKQLGYNGDGNPSVGGALLEAKQQYYNEKANGTLSVYDEKLMGEMTLYGLPMQKVQLPNQTGVEPDGTIAGAAIAATETVAAGPTSGDATAAVAPAPQPPIDGLTQTPINLSLSYDPTDVSRGRYYSVVGGTTQEEAERPVLPLAIVGRDSNQVALRGVLMLGGTFNDTPNFDPVIVGMVFDDTSNIQAQELRYDVAQWTPNLPATVNRFIDADEGMFSQNVTVVPGQFYATTNANDPQTKGIMRLYSSLQLLAYEGPADALDYQAPGIWDVDAVNPEGKVVTFSALVRDTDTSELAPATGILRVVVLYRHLGSNTWSNVDLDYNATTEVAAKSVVVPQNGQYEYFVQAVDNAGNVAALLDHGNFFSIEVTGGTEPDERLIYVAARTGGTIDGIQFQNNDILAYLPEQDEWVMYFDADDVGFGQNLNALSLIHI